MRIRQWIIGCVGGLTACTVLAAESAIEPLQSSARVVGKADVLNWAGGLALVLGLFLVLVWLLKKSGGLPVLSKSPLTVLGGLSLGMREKVVLIRVGDKQLLLGVTPGRISKLLELQGDERLFLDRDTPETGSFADKLLQAVRKGKINE